MKSFADKAGRLSVKYQIILLTVFLCLFPFATILFYTVHDSINAMQQKLLAREEENLDRTRMQMEVYKESAEAYFTSKAIKDVFFSYCYEDLDYRKYTSLKNTQQELENFSYGQNLLENAYFINFDYSYIIGKHYANHYINEYNLDNPIQLQTKLTKDNNLTVHWAYIPPWKGLLRGDKYPDILIEGNVLLIPYPIFNTNSQSVLLVQMDSEKAEEILEPANGSDKIFLILNEDNTVIYSKDPALAGKSASKIPFLSSLNREERKSVQPIIKDGENAYLISVRDDDGWVYLSINSATRINQEVGSLRNTFVFFAVISILVLLAASYLFATWLYRPIASIASKMNHFARDIKEKNEFHIIEKEYEQYAEQMVFYRNSQKELFLTKLLKNIISLADIQNEILRTELPKHSPEMMILVFQILDIDHTTPNSDVLAVEKIYSMLSLEFLVTGTYYQGLFVVWLQNTTSDPEFEEKLRKECKQLKKVMSTESYILSLGQSPLFHDYSQVCQSYQAATSDLSSTPEGTESYDQLPVHTQEFYPIALCEQLADSIYNDGLEETEKLLAAISRNIYNPQNDTQRQQISTICTVAGLFMATSKRGPIPYEVFPDRPLDMLLNIHNTHTMNYYFEKEMLNPISAWMKEKNSNSEKELSQSVIQMIQNNFHTDITLEQCADELDCHPVYLSQLFREQTGMTFPQYLDNYRYYTAKKWLLESNMSVAEIAERLKYSNAQNFIRSFKKKTGITPGKYREINQ